MTKQALSYPAFLGGRGEAELVGFPIKVLSAIIKCEVLS